VCCAYRVYERNQKTVIKQIASAKNVKPSTIAAAITIEKKIRPPASGWRAMASTALPPIAARLKLAPMTIAAQQTTAATIAQVEAPAAAAANKLVVKPTIVFQTSKQILVTESSYKPNYYFKDQRFFAFENQRDNDNNHYNFALWYLILVLR
jgi:hypothetical protein